ncbi:hypothetical protein CALVIDRAFT_540595 [Calocera viscosa TUFC12733]|uniref:Uncharacterized protein n=1 Tax=Calocera viscosa (strain TUFC12733) TaxID=1330018 RepID=A0A167ISQ5_CALVF|nr:hypothetical protein CALVIDRAFT_540595 [Calocera viscosa TUFC12733]
MTPLHRALDHLLTQHSPLPIPPSPGKLKPVPPPPQPEHILLPPLAQLRQGAVREGPVVRGSSVREGGAPRPAWGRGQVQRRGDNAMVSGDSAGELVQLLSLSLPGKQSKT